MRCPSCWSLVLYDRASSTVNVANDDNMPVVEKWLIPLGNFSYKFPEGSVCCGRPAEKLVDLRLSTSGANSGVAAAGVAGALIGGRFGGALAQGVAGGVAEVTDSAGKNYSFEGVPVCLEHENKVKLVVIKKKVFLSVPYRQSAMRFRAANR